MYVFQSQGTKQQNDNKSIQGSIFTLMLIYLFSASAYTPCKQCFIFCFFFYRKIGAVNDLFYFRFHLVHVCIPNVLALLKQKQINAIAFIIMQSKIICVGDFNNIWVNDY